MTTSAAPPELVCDCTGGDDEHHPNCALLKHPAPERQQPPSVPAGLEAAINACRQVQDGYDKQYGPGPKESTSAISDCIGKINALIGQPIPRLYTLDQMREYADKFHQSRLAATQQPPGEDAGVREAFEKWWYKARIPWAQPMETAWLAWQAALSQALHRPADEARTRMVNQAVAWRCVHCKTVVWGLYSGCSNCGKDPTK